MLTDIKNSLDTVKPETIRLYFIKRRKTNHEIRYTVLKTEITKSVASKLLVIAKNKVRSIFPEMKI